MSTALIDPETTTVELTDKQRDVLRLVKEGKTPTEIGKALEISSQAVHGHFRRLRELGAMAPTDNTAKPAAPQRTRRVQVQHHANMHLDADAVLNAVKLAAAQQRSQLDAREQQIDAEMEQLKAEKKTLADARKKLDAMVPPEDA